MKHTMPTGRGEEENGPLKGLAWLRRRREWPLEAWKYGRNVAERRGRRCF